MLPTLAESKSHQPCPVLIFVLSCDRDFTPDRMCRFNLRLPGSDKLLRKRTVIRSTLPALVEKLNGTFCKKDHAHQQIAGSSRVNGQTVPVSRFAASYSQGFARAVAQVLVSPSHAAPTSAYPAFEPPKTRKRFKSSSGAVPVTQPAERKRSLPEQSSAPKRSRVPDLPVLEIPETFDAEQWQRIPQGLSSCAVRVGTCNISASNPVFTQVQNLIPKVSIARMFVSRHVKQFQMPIGAPPPSSEAPWRLSLGWMDINVPSPVVLAFERRKDLGRADLVRNCPEQEMLITLFLKGQPRDPPAESPTPSAPVPVPDVPTAEPAPAKKETPDCLEGWGPPPTPLHGPAFRALSSAEKTDLIRLHRNLGHPAPLKLAEHLQTAKALPHIIAAAKDFVCDACVESATPKHRRPSKLHDPREFNDTVGLDTFYWRGSAGFQVHVLHAIDESSCFQTGRRIAERNHAFPAFREFWVQWAGAPKHLYLDPAGELRSNELEVKLQGMSTTLFVTAAAWQRGALNDTDKS